MRWAGHVARMEEITYKILIGEVEEKRPFLRPGVDWGIILKRILEKPGGKLCTGLFRVRLGTSGGLL